MPKFIRVCKLCEAEFETHHETASYCSRYHKERAGSLRKRARQAFNSNVYCKVTFDYCTFCGGAYCQRRPHARYCSEGCSNAKKNDDYRKRQNALNTKAIGFRQKIYFRDGGLCQVCQEPVLLSDLYPHPKSLSIDHIVPISKGGTHALYNLQLAHLRCNIMKSNNV